MIVPMFFVYGLRTVKLLLQFVDLSKQNWVHRLMYPILNICGMMLMPLPQQPEQQPNVRWAHGRESKIHS